jgi:CBS domain containing-hemolysin-like protein
MELWLAFILLFLSSFFSASEMAFISANKIKLEIRSNSSLFARIAYDFTKKTGKIPHHDFNRE